MPIVINTANNVDVFISTNFTLFVLIVFFLFKSILINGVFFWFLVASNDLDTKRSAARQYDFVSGVV